MNTVIIYATKTGGTEQCAQLISQEIDTCDLINIEEQQPNLDAYEIIVLGAGVKNNTIYKPMRDFLKANHDLLLTKKCAYFFCNGKEKSVPEITNKVFKADLRDQAIFVEAFGGYKEHWIPLKDGEELRGINIDKVKSAAQLLKQ